ncbi:MYXO-CTERM domain-containing protein [Pseudenhygromyxa sp. WMMC2535]|uniref:MYXO-CTERM sorting domain-containing protein n=1 Tax=Pseudenhygromyxa sp. WMMC2535 TaxID=2712867 RepID=UPI0015516A22|nr:MYXO-CTERM sorting domain-containing protein [Pseudenhygromyxa sp. WMMC2535]NVB40254.1 MYXO-CTERM domain-containing protein [Pseudenhygromyxa sp. WMMC2535]
MDSLLLRHRALSALTPLLSLSALLFAGSADAAEVECSSDYGSCEVNNDNWDSVSCSCGSEGSDGSTGGDDWSGLSEAELLEICQDHLDWCEEFSDEGYETFGTSTSTGSDTGWSDSEDGSDGLDWGEVTSTGGTATTFSDTAWEEGEGEGEGEGEVTTAGESFTTFGDSGSDSGWDDGDAEEWGETEGTTDSGGATSGGEGDSAADDGTSGADGETAAETTDGASDTGNDAGDAGDGADGDADGSEGGLGEGDTGGETGGDGGGVDDVDQGCSCSTQTRSGLSVMALALLGLFGLRRRE